MPVIPKTMIVVGGGVIGVEYVCMFATLGVRVTLIEKRPRLLEFATLEWVDWFNHRRLFEPIGNVPPAEAEARYYDQMEVPARAA